MFGKKPGLNPLESRKRLLIAESELNRAQLAGDMAALTTGIRTLTGRAKSFGAIASSGRGAAGGPGNLQARQARGRQREAFLAANHS